MRVLWIVWIELGRVVLPGGNWAEFDPGEVGLRVRYQSGKPEPDIPVEIDGGYLWFP